MHIKQEKNELESRTQKIKIEAEKEILKKQEVKKTIKKNYSICHKYLAQLQLSLQDGD